MLRILIKRIHVDIIYDLQKTDISWQHELKIACMSIAVY
jgi:hypothetical protein